MPLIEYADPEPADERVADVFSAEARKYGRPSLFSRMLANNPAVLAARSEYAAALNEGGAVDPILKELVYVAVSEETGVTTAPPATPSTSSSRRTLPSHSSRQLLPTSLTHSTLASVRSSRSHGRWLETRNASRTTISTR